MSVEERFDEIVPFAELERHVDQKLKNFSSGMDVRLAYSIAIRVDFDILLLDEVLAVGDQAFQDKCFATFDRLRKAGKTVVLVSHDLNAMAKALRSGPLAGKRHCAPGGVRRGCDHLLRTAGSPSTRGPRVSGVAPWVIAGRRLVFLDGFLQAR